MFFCQIVPFDDVWKSRKRSLLSSFSFRPDTFVIKLVAVLIAEARRLGGIEAVILIIIHRMFRANLAAQLIKPIDFNINNPFPHIKIVGVDQIATVFSFPISLQYAVSVLSFAMIVHCMVWTVSLS